MDVTYGFLHGDLEEEVCTTMPLAYTIARYEREVLRSMVFVKKPKMWKLIIYEGWKRHQDTKLLVGLVSMALSN